VSWERTVPQARGPFALSSTGDEPPLLVAACPAVSSDQHLSLGALYREMRAGLGDAGRVRVTVEFQQRTVAAADEQGAAEPVSLVLETLVEYEDRVLDRAQVALHGAGPSKRFLVARHGSAYAYSLDGGERWGRLAAHPRIFDVEEFEAELGQVVVEDATYDVLDGSRDLQGPAVWGPERFVDALDVGMDREAFLRLLRVFSADVDDDADAPALSAFSVSLQAADDVSLQYWWSLSDSVSEADDIPIKIRCSVSIRVAALGAEETAAVRLDVALPDVADLDGVWAILRHSAPEAAGEDRGPEGR
jgi:hypothetical protein